MRIITALSLLFSITSNCSGQLEALEGMDAMRAFSRMSRAASRAPTLDNLDTQGLSLRDIKANTVKDGTQGVPHYGEGIGLNGGHPSEFQVIQVMDETNVLITALGITWWLEQPSTKGIVDGNKLKLEGMIYKYDGTKQYTTVLGAPASTYHLTYVGRNKNKPDAHDWTMPDGTKQYGQFIQFAQGSGGKQAEIITEDNTTKTITLTEADKKIARKILMDQKKKERLATTKRKRR